MIHATHVDHREPVAPPLVDPLERDAATHQVGEAIAVLAARIHAATYELLTLLHEFDRRTGWNTGFMSCAHWLHWRTGIDLGAAREKVRVAKALPALPRISMSMQRGQLSYAKVRALTRVATPHNEAALLDFALAGSAAQVERFVRAWRRVDRAEQAQVDEARHLNRQLATWLDDDGMVVIRGRLTPEVGAVVQRALEAAADRLFRDSKAVAASELSDTVTPAQRRADALGLLAEAALASDLDRGTAGDRYQVVLHVDASAPSDTAAPFDGVIELDHGAQHVSPETSRRVSCDCAVVRMAHDDNASVVDVGRRTRTIPPAIRRALSARDRTCGFPGCSSRRCDAHHVEHWVDGGATSLDNLVLLCRRHHRAVHEGGFGVARKADGTWAFTRADGTIVHEAPALPAVPAPLDDWAGPEPDPPPTWDGTRFDLGWAIDVLRPALLPGSPACFDEHLVTRHARARATPGSTCGAPDSACARCHVS